MKKFSEIRQRAEKRKAGAAKLKKMLPKVATEKALINTTDDRYLAMMTKAINQAGFSWKVIENKWPEFEEAFFGFNLRKLELIKAQHLFPP